MIYFIFISSVSRSVFVSPSPSPSHQPSAGYIFQTFVRGKVCYFESGSDPNIVSPLCKYWRVDADTCAIEELRSTYPKIIAQQKYRNLLKVNQIIPGGCADTEYEEICMKQASDDNENAFLYTLDSKKNIISAHIRNIATNTKEEIISDIKSTGCMGEITSWSDQSGDILFLDRFYATPQSPSGEMLSTVCIYNYKTKSLIYKKSLPVDTYQNSISDMRNGLVFIYNYFNPNILVHYRNRQEEIIPIKQDQTIMDHIDVTFKYGLILLQSAKPNGFYIEGYDIEQKKVIVNALLSRELPAHKLETPQTDSIRFINMSDDQKNLMFEYQPSNDLNTPNYSPCKLNVKIATGTVNKVACGYQFQAKYSYKTPPIFDEYVYADFIDWD